jgi:chromosomal replication initiator protein
MLARSFIRKCVVPVRSYTATEFLREFAGAVRRRQLSAFRDSFEESRGLVLDEIHRLKGKKRGQAEFVRLLARLVELGRPVLMASRHHPHDIQALQPSLASRLLSGFVVEVFPPKWEARMQCLRNLEAAAGKRLPDAVLTRIADCYRGGYSGLKEAWKRLWERLPERAGLADSRLHDEVMSVLGQRDDPLLELVKRVAAFFGVSPEELMERGQARRLSTPRQLVQFLAVRRGLSAAEVGRRFDGKTRAAVSYSCKELMKKIEQDPNLARLVEELS